MRVLGLLLFGREEVLTSALPTHEVAFRRSRAPTCWSTILPRASATSAGRTVGPFSGAEQGARGAGRYDPRWCGRLCGAFFREAVAMPWYTGIHQSGAVHIQWRADRLEVSNPGDFRPESAGQSVGRRRGHAIHCWPTHSNALAWWSAPGGALTPYFTSRLRNGRAGALLRTQHGDRRHPGAGRRRAQLGLVRLVAEEGLDSIPLSLEDLLVLDTLYARSYDGARRSRSPAEGGGRSAGCPEILGGARLGFWARYRVRRWYQLSDDAARRIGDGGGDQRRRVEPVGMATWCAGTLRSTVPFRSRSRPIYATSRIPRPTGC